MRKKFRGLLLILMGFPLAGSLWSGDADVRRAIPYHAPAIAAVAPPSKPSVLPASDPLDAIALSLADVLAFNPPVCRCYIRYLWVNSGNTAATRVSSLALNYISRNSVIIRPATLANGYLIRVDLRDYVSTDRDLSEWVKIWEKLAFDPMFNQILTKDDVKFNEKLQVDLPGGDLGAILRTVTKSIVVDHPGGPYVYPDDSGRRHDSLPAGKYTVELEFHVRDTAKAKTTTVAKSTVDAIRCTPPHFPRTIFRLQEETHTQAPIVDYRYFVMRALTTVKEDGVYAKIFGGLYYDFKGIRKAKAVLGKDTKATDLDLFLEDLGVGNIKAGLTADKLFAKLPSNRRIAMAKSNVTSSQREVTMHPTLSTGDDLSWGAITGDLKRKSISIGQRIMANLLEPFRDGREAIFPGVNGLDEFAAFDGQDNLLDAVVQDIASDTTVPAPFHQTLQSAISCIRCHGPYDGWQPLTNDVTKILAWKPDIFGDLSQGRNATSFDTVKKLTSLYTGNFTKNLIRKRDDVAEKTLLATGSWDPTDPQAGVARVSAQAIADHYAEYNYTTIDAQKAMRESGLDVSSDKAIAVFRTIMELPITNPTGVRLEKSTIVDLASGIPVLRSDFALVQSEIQGRIQKNSKKAIGQ